MSREERREQILKRQDWEFVSAQDASILLRWRIRDFRKRSESVGLPKFIKGKSTYYIMGDVKALPLKLTQHEETK